MQSSNRVWKYGGGWTDHRLDVPRAFNNFRNLTWWRGSPNVIPGYVVERYRNVGEQKTPRNEKE